MGVSISFHDVTRQRELKEEVNKSHQELETAHEEFQSTNEELEKTNEELQSTNEELHTLNDKLHLRTKELNQVNALANSILASLENGVIVVDKQLRIISWNEESSNLWGLRAEEVQEQSLLSLDIGLPIRELQEPIRICLLGKTKHQEIALSAINRRGRAIECQVTFNPLIDLQSEIQRIIISVNAIVKEP